MKYELSTISSKSWRVQPFDNSALVCIRGHDYLVECVAAEGRSSQVHRLRAAVFCSELRWVGLPGQRIERDVFDRFAVHLCVWVEGELAGYLRIHRHCDPWMAYDVFPHAVGEGVDFRRPGYCEVSRLAVALRYRTTRLSDGSSIAELLYQALFTYCEVTGIHTCCMIVSRRVLRALRMRGLPCELANTKPLPPSVHVHAPVLALLNWTRFKTSDLSNRDLLVRRYVAFRDRAWIGGALHMGTSGVQP